jgi:hypothetical protein
LKGMIPVYFFFSYKVPAMWVTMGNPCFSMYADSVTGVAYTIIKGNNF